MADGGVDGLKLLPVTGDLGVFCRSAIPGGEREGAGKSVRQGEDTYRLGQGRHPVGVALEDGHRFQGSSNARFRTVELALEVHLLVALLLEGRGRGHGTEHGCRQGGETEGAAHLRVWR